MSDDNKHKLKYEDFINKCHDIAVAHEKYCNNNCFNDNKTGWYPHTKDCMEYRKAHHESFVECNSIFCIKMNSLEYLKPSYLREIDKPKIITELTYHSSSDDE